MTAADRILERLLGSGTEPDDPPALHRALHPHPSPHRGVDGHWYVHTHEDCRRLLLDPRLRRRPERPRLGISADQSRHVHRRPHRLVLFEGPPGHAPLRAALRGPFRAPPVAALAPRVEELVDAALDRLDGRAELMGEVIRPLTAQVIAEVIGVPAGDRDHIRDLVLRSTAALEPGASTDVLGAAATADDAIEAFFRELIAERRRRPGDDLVSALVSTPATGDPLDDDEVLGNVVLLFPAGFVTTACLIGNGLLALLRHPAELARVGRVLRVPTLLAGAVEESVRYDGPAQVRTRTVLEPVALGGHTLTPGETVVLLLGAANRDPRAFDDPDRFDPSRRGGAHLGFGAGPHHCLGAPLARLEAATVLGRLLARFPRISLSGPAPVQSGLQARGPAQLWVDTGRR